MSYKELITYHKNEKENDNEHIYYNINITNIYKDSEAPIIAQLNDQTNQILQKQSDYQCVVTFWSLRGEIPIFYCPIKEGSNSNRNLTNFGVCYSYLGFDYSDPIIYVPQSGNLNVPLPNPPSLNNGIQDLIADPYYYTVWSFQHFLNMINTSLTNAYNAFNAVHPGVHSSPVWFQYDENSGLISMIAEYSYANRAGADIFCNALLLNYFESIETDYIGYDKPNFKDYRFILVHDFTNRNAYALPGSTIPTPPLNPLYIKLQQEYETRYTWANIRSILFTSNTIQTRNEYVPQIRNPNATQNNNIDRFNSNFLNILSYYDIIYDTSGLSGASWRQYLFYNPQIYKWIDLVGDMSLQSFNINIYIKLTNGQLIPLELPSGTSADIKLLFRKIKK